MSKSMTRNELGQKPTLEEWQAAIPPAAARGWRRPPSSRACSDRRCRPCPTRRPPAHRRVPSRRGPDGPVTDRQLPDPPGDRPGWDGGRLQGAADEPEPDRRHQDDPGRRARGPAGTGEAPERGRGRRPDHPYQRRPDLRDRRARRPALPGHGIRRRRQPDPDAPGHAPGVPLVGPARPRSSPGRSMSPTSGGSSIAT